jgi:hypothetical protein
VLTVVPPAEIREEDGFRAIWDDTGWCEVVQEERKAMANMLARLIWEWWSAKGGLLRRALLSGGNGEQGKEEKKTTDSRI